MITRLRTLMFVGAWIVSLSGGLVPQSASGVETVRVDDAAGAPRLVADGKPVRARIFFGNPGSRPLPVGPAGQRISFDFTALHTATNHATMHWRFGDIPGDVWLDDIEVADLDNGEKVLPRCTFEQGTAQLTHDWAYWPVGPQNTVGSLRVDSGAGSEGSGALHLTLKSPPSGVWPGYHIFHQPNLSLIQGHHYRVSFWARAVPERTVMIGFYEPGSPYVYIGGPETFQSQIKMAAAVGVNFVSFGVEMPWTKNSLTTDWTAVDDACQRVLDANPSALLIPRINIRPPKDWMDVHPDELMVWDAPYTHGVTASVASSLYRHEAAEHLTALVCHLEEKFGPHMAGYHPAGQSINEWFYEGTWGRLLNGYGRADLAAWRIWLRARYATDAALQAAWHDSKVTLSEAGVPSAQARRDAPGGVLRDPAREQPVIDFTDFQQESMADCVCEMAHVVRQATHGRKLVLFFYGYLFEFATVGNGPGTSGHYALRQVLDCPDIDVLCSPISYFDRQLGGGAPAMTAAESIALAGKMYLREDDTFTYLALPNQKPPGYLAAVHTEEETAQELERNVAQCALRNFATWWMDLPGTGWFQDPRLWAVMDRLNPLDQYMLDHPTPYAPEVAAVIDETSMRRVAYHENQVSPGISGARLPLGRMGAPYGQYLQDDVAAGKVHAKLYVFLSSWVLSEEQRRRLLEATRGSMRIWCFAPGYQDGDHGSPAAMNELTGFQIRQVKGTAAWAEPTASGKLAGLTGFGVKGQVKPLFAVTDATPGEILATWSDGSTAVALRHTGDGFSMFVGAPGLTPELLRLAARKAGVHLYTESDCNVWASGPFLVLHGARDGLLTINTGQSGPVTDFLTGTGVSSGPRFSLFLKKGETRVLKVRQ